MAGKDIEKLTEEDRLMRQFAAVERFGTKLQIMSFMTNFDENIKNVKPQVDTLSVAAKSLRNSKKMKRILELILALGNYMNSNKKGDLQFHEIFCLYNVVSCNFTKFMLKIINFFLSFAGPCYGFKLQSLDSLTITKTSDKKENLVHYLAKLVHEKFPELKDFASELKYLEKAVQLSMENILTGIFHKFSQFFAL